MFLDSVVSPNVCTRRDPNAPQTIYNSQHVGTTTHNAKNVATPFASYSIPRFKAVEWFKKRKQIIETFMLGINWANVDNTLNFLCYWNGDLVVDGVYARPGITGAQPFAAGQNRSFDVVSTARIQGIDSETATTGIVRPRTHTKWNCSFGGTIEFGGQEEYLWGQTPVSIGGDIIVTWQYYLQGTGSPQFYFDHLNVTLR